MSTPHIDPSPITREPLAEERLQVPEALAFLSAPKLERAPREQLDLESQTIKTYFAERAVEWEKDLQTRLGGEARFVLEGAMRCGLYRGPRPSKNPELSGRPLREADFSLRV